MAPGPAPHRASGAHSPPPTPRVPLGPQCPCGHWPLLCWHRVLVPRACAPSARGRPWEPGATFCPAPRPPIQAFLLLMCAARRQKAIRVSHPLCSAVGADSCRRPTAGLTRPLTSWFLYVLTAKGICGLGLGIKAQLARRGTGGRGQGWPRARVPGAPAPHTPRSPWKLTNTSVSLLKRI